MPVQGYEDVIVMNDGLTWEVVRAESVVIDVEEFYVQKMKEGEHIDDVLLDSPHHRDIIALKDLIECWKEKNRP